MEQRPYEGNITENCTQFLVTLSEFIFQKNILGCGVFPGYGKFSAVFHFKALMGYGEDIAHVHKIGTGAFDKGFQGGDIGRLLVKAIPGGYGFDFAVVVEVINQAVVKIFHGVNLLRPQGD